MVDESLSLLVEFVGDGLRTLAEKPLLQPIWELILDGLVDMETYIDDGFLLYPTIIQ
jgi:hypothetical protein